VNVTLNSVTTVSGGNAILMSSGTSTTNTLTVNSGASITGSVRMFGNDNVNFNGGDISAVTFIDAFAGTDSVSFTNTGGAQAVSGSQLLNFENFMVGSGGNVSLSRTLNVNTVTVENGGILGGTGTMNANVGVTDGTLSAGNSSGLLSIVGNLDLGAAATTLVELEGLTAGSQYDQIDVAAGFSTLTAGATFDIDFFGVFTAGLGDSFDILVAVGIIGDVNTLNFGFTNALLAAGLEWDTSIVVNGIGRDALRLTVQESIALPEPSGIALFTTSLLGLRHRRDRRRRKA
jgi:fibronectin-binding autotransporter adhesin